MKQFEQENRRKLGYGHEIKIHSNSTHVPQGNAFKQFLLNPQNKAHLTQFLGKELLNIAHEELDIDQSLCVSYGSSGLRTAKLALNGTEHSLPHLESHQQEADGCLILHASKVSDIASCVIVWSPDTDVAVLCLNFYDKIVNELWFKTGVAGKVRFICINNLVDKITLRQALEFLLFMP